MSPAVDIVDASGAGATTVELPADIFDVQVNVPLIHQVVVAQLAAARHRTAAQCAAKSSPRTRSLSRSTCSGVAPS